MKNIEKNCLQSLKGQNKLLANTICLQRCLNEKNSLQRKVFHTAPPLSFPGK